MKPGYIPQEEQSKYRPAAAAAAEARRAASTRCSPTYPHYPLNVFFHQALFGGLPIGGMPAASGSGSASGGSSSGVRGRGSGSASAGFGAGAAVAASGGDSGGGGKSSSHVKRTEKRDTARQAVEEQVLAARLAGASLEDAIAQTQAKAASASASGSGSGGGKAKAMAGAAPAPGKHICRIYRSDSMRRHPTQLLRRLLSRRGTKTLPRT